jgi:hypothetical protein
VPEPRLATLSDRTPAKISISSDRNWVLNEYAGIYCVTHGELEIVAERIPFMFEAVHRSQDQLRGTTSCRGPKAAKVQQARNIQ